MKSIRTITMIGVGAMGSFLAPRLYLLLGKQNFRIIAEGRRKEKLERQGIRINDVVYRFPIMTPKEDCVPSDLVIIGVKATDLSAALEDISRHIGPDTIIISLLNGVDSEKKIADRYGMEHVLYALMRISIHMENLCCHYDPKGGFIFFGEKKNTVLSKRVQLVKSLFDRADIPYQIPEDMIHAQWFKFMANVGENLICSLLSIPFLSYHVSEHVDFLRVKAMEEVITIANQLGIDLGKEELQNQRKAISTIPFHNKPSTLQDLEAGRKTEIEIFAGEVIRLGKELNVPTPINEFLYHSILVLEEKNLGLLNQYRV